MDACYAVCGGKLGSFGGGLSSEGREPFFAKSRMEVRMCAEVQVAETPKEGWVKFEGQLVDPGFTDERQVMPLRKQHTKRGKAKAKGKARRTPRTGAALAVQLVQIIKNFLPVWSAVVRVAWRGQRCWAQRLWAQRSRAQRWWERHCMNFAS